MARNRVLVVDDEEGILEVVADTLSELLDTHTAVESDGEKAAARLAAERFDLLIADLRMPGLGGIELLRLARQHDPAMPVLMLTAYPSVETAVESMKLGATDYLLKPFVPDDLLATVRRVLAERRLHDENELLSRHVARDYVFDDIVGSSAVMRAMFDTIERTAPTDLAVLITGETGTGKELVARSIHRRSRRASARFVPVDCGAMPETLIESELFGHERGAFTGAHGRRLGLLELADGGTVFLDEVGELPVHMQAKLLRVLQERTFRRIGGGEEVSVDVRVLAATSRDLAREVKAARFRSDLLYRLNVVHVELPPLRERPEDVEALVEHIRGRCTHEMHKPVAISVDALEVLRRHPWPGNVRELQNVVRRAVALARGPELTVDDLPDEVVVGAATAARDERDGFFALRAERMRRFERHYLVQLLQRHRGNVPQAAEAARVPRGTLYRLLKSHGLAADDYRA